MNEVAKYKTAVWQLGKVNGFASSDIFNQKNGNLKFIKVEPNSHYPLHQHVEKTECAIVLEGKPTITIKEVEYNAENGDVYIFTAHTKHAISNNTNEVCILLIAAINDI